MNQRGEMDFDANLIEAIHEMIVRNSPFKPNERESMILWFSEDVRTEI